MLVKDKQQLIAYLSPLKGAWVTGTSGSAKSTIGHTLRSKGFKVHDLDDAAQHCKFSSGSDYWIADAIPAFGNDFIVGTCDNDTLILEMCKVKHVILPTLEYEVYVRVMASKAADHAKRHGAKDAFASDFAKKSKYSKSQFERSYRENVRYFRCLGAYFGFQVHTLTLAEMPADENPWARKGY